MLMAPCRCREPNSSTFSVRRPISCSVGGGELQGSGDRCGADRDRQRRVERSARDQENGRNDHRRRTRAPRSSSACRRAIQTGVVDFVLPLKEIGPALTTLVRGEAHELSERVPRCSSSAARAPPAEPRLRFHRLQAVEPRCAACGSGCRPPTSTAMRAIRTTSKRTRTSSRSCSTPSLINVTGFFRDAQLWEFLRDDSFRILQLRQGDASIRVWSAGCASGEEAYSSRCCSPKRSGPSGSSERVKIYATDVDEEALSQARQAAYSRTGARGDPRALLEKILRARRATATCFRRSAAVGHLRPSRPDPGRADLPRRPARLPQYADVLQRRDAGADPDRFHFALRRRGFLFLGKAEMLLRHGRTCSRRSI